MEPMTPIHTAELFPGLHVEFVALLRGLDDDAWRKPTVAGENAWSVVRQASAWQVFRGAAPDAVARVRVDADAAWRLFFNALPPDAARARVTIEGGAALAEPLLRARSVMV